MSKSAFIHKTVRCPACKRESRQRVFRHRLFVAEATESDLHIIQYRWLADDVEKTHPAYHFICLCPQCGFADTAEDFMKPPRSVAHGRTVKGFQDDGASDPVMRSLIGAIDYSNIDFKSALCLHLLALRIHATANEAVQDSYKIGRVLLRIAWLYRERSVSESPSAETISPFSLPPIANSRAIVSQAARQTDGAPGANGSSELDGLQQSAAALARQWELVTEEWSRTRSLIAKRIQEMALEKNQKRPNPYLARLAALDSAFRPVSLELTRLQAVCGQDTASAPPPNPKPAPHSFPPREPRPGPTWLTPPQPSITDETIERFVARLRVEWPEAPFTERDAMLLAIQSFKRALFGDPRFNDAHNFMTISELTADLAIRCGDFDGALEVVKGIYNPGLDERNRLQARLRNTSLTETEQRKLHAGMRRASDAVERAGELRRTLLQRIEDREMPKISTIARDTGARGNDLERALLEQGILPELVARLKKRGELYTGLAARH